jgi:hypothetical protein
MEIIDLIKQGDEFVNKDGKIILRIIDNRIYEYVNGDYIRYKKLKYDR